VTVPAGKLVEAIAAVRELAGSGAIDDARSASEVFAAAAIGAASFFTGVRSEAGVEVGVAPAGGCVEETIGPLYPLWLGAGVAGFVVGVAFGLASAGG
jgi:hypothetical protein